MDALRDEKSDAKGSFDNSPLNTENSTVNKVIHKVKDLRPEDVKSTAMDIGRKVRDTSNQFYSDTSEFVKSNPVGAAAGLLGFGFVVGLLAGLWRKSE
jgi:ElaB/YqjD/DUF883 family membrane-anchored ribosome-binding protein